MYVRTFNTSVLVNYSFKNVSQFSPGKLFNIFKTQRINKYSFYGNEEAATVKLVSIN